MKQHSRASTYLERLDMVAYTTAGAGDAAVAEQLGWSRWTVRKWRRRSQRHGSAALVRRMGRPQVGAAGSFPQTLRDEMLRMRTANPGWGPKTILVELQKDPCFARHKLPSRSTIAAFLQAQQKTRQYRRHTHLQHANIQRGTYAHEEWELDAKGAIKLPGLGRVCIINVLDTFSRVKTASLAVGPTTKPRTEDYQLACRCAFMRFGLPDRITLDHDVAFIETTCPSPFPRRLHLWFIGLGIAVRFIEHPPPREHSLIERGHQTLVAQALTAPSPSTLAAFNVQLGQRRVFLNYDYPSTVFGDLAPLQAHPQAAHPRRTYTPQLEAELLDLQRIDDYLAQHTWYRPVFKAGQFWIHRKCYNVGRQWAGHTLTIRFVPTTRSFVCTSETGEPLAVLEALGLAKADLMGELPPWQHMTTYQLHLPLSPPHLREAALYREMAGTT